MRVFVSSVGVKAPGLDSLDDLGKLAQPGASESSSFKLAAPGLLPAAERRRSSQSVRIALEVAAQALAVERAEHLQPDAIFASAYGDTGVTHKLCELLRETPPAASPTLFHNSVHNAPAGYWSISIRLNSATNSIAAGAGTFATGLLLAATRCRVEHSDVLLVCYDLPYGEPLNQKCRVDAPFASALLLSAQPRDDSLASLSLERVRGQEPGTMEIADWEHLRSGNPAARALPLLQALVARQREKVILELDQTWRLKIEVADVE